MPANIVKSPADEKKWDRAKQIVKKQKGRKPKTDRDWGLVTHIFKNMKRGSAMSRTPYLDAWISKEKTAGRLGGIMEGLTGGRGLRGFGEALSAGTTIRDPQKLTDLFRFNPDALNETIRNLPPEMKEKLFRAPLAAGMGMAAPEIAGIGALGAAGSGLAGIHQLAGGGD